MSIVSVKNTAEPHSPAERIAGCKTAADMLAALGGGLLRTSAGVRILGEFSLETIQDLVWTPPSASASVNQEQPLPFASGQLAEFISTLKVVAEKTTEAVSTLKQVAETTTATQAAVMSAVSSTIPASKISKENLLMIHTAAQTAIVCAEENDEGDLATLIGETLTPADEDFWNQDITEPSQRKEYSDKIKEMAGPNNRNSANKLRGVVWKDATGETIKLSVRGAVRTVAARNDELLVATRMSGSTMARAAIMGVELKKKLTYKGLRQAQALFLVCSAASMFPFMQLITDMEHGGVAYFYSGHTTNCTRMIVERVLCDMDAVWAFMRGAIESLEPSFGSFDSGRNQYVVPAEVSNPKRIKLDVKPAESGPVASSSGRDVFTLLAQMLNNEGDVACMRDVMGGPEEFQLPPCPLDRPCMYIS